MIEKNQLPYHYLGKPWHTVRPPLLGSHRCYVQSIVSGMDGGGRCGEVEHCPCGATRMVGERRWWWRMTRGKSYYRKPFAKWLYRITHRL